MQMQPVFDVIIVGAGPAGSTAALAMGKSGLKIALLDKASFPRDKICGDAVAAYVPKVLNTIDPVYAKRFKEFTQKERVDTIRIITPGEKQLDINFGEDGFIIKRIVLDNFLFEMASELSVVTVFQNTSVEDIIITDEKAIVKTTDGSLEAKLVIGCDGANGIARKKLCKEENNLSHHAAAVRAYFKNVKSIPPATFELHFLKGITPGYFWVFPLPGNEANVGLGLLSQTVSTEKINLRKEMQQVIDSVPYLKERFSTAEMISDIKGYGLPLGSRKVTVSGNRFMLCGDAASLIDPLTGEGIGQAMVSGRYAGWQAVKCFQQSDFSAAFMKQYDKTVYDKLWKTHRRSYLIREYIVRHPRLFNACVRLLVANKWLFNQAKKFLK